MNGVAVNLALIWKRVIELSREGIFFRNLLEDFSSRSLLIAFIMFSLPQREKEKSFFRVRKRVRCQATDGAVPIFVGDF